MEWRRWNKSQSAWSLPLERASQEQWVDVGFTNRFIPCQIRVSRTGPFKPLAATKELVQDYNTFMSEGWHLILRVLDEFLDHFNLVRCPVLLFGYNGG